MLQWAIQFLERRMPMRLPAALLLACPLVAAALASDAPQTNWPRFRGPGASGIAEGNVMPVSWSLDTKAGLAWRTPVPGLAHSSPVVWGDSVYLTTAVSASGLVPAQGRPLRGHRARSDRARAPLRRLPDRQADGEGPLGAHRPRGRAAAARATPSPPTRTRPRPRTGRRSSSSSAPKASTATTSTASSSGRRTSGRSTRRTSRPPTRSGASPARRSSTRASSTCSATS